jgi:hypothetical protein
MNPVNAIVGALAVALSLVAFFAVVAAFFPYRVSRMEVVIDGMPGRSFVVGLVNLIFFGAVMLVFFSLAERFNGGGLRAVGGIFLVCLSIGVSFGLAGVVQVLGARIKDGATGLVRTAWGTILLALACGLPFVGWFGLLPYAAGLGLGGFILSFFTRPDVE